MLRCSVYQSSLPHYTLTKIRTMQIFKIFILFYLSLNCVLCYSQDIPIDKEVEKIVKLGKDSIVKLALKSIDKKARIQNFSKINVTTNGKDVFVSLRNPIKYLPIETGFYFDVEISVLEKTARYGPIFNGIMDSKKDAIPFYSQTKEIGQNIQFVIESINRSASVGSIDAANFEDDMTIREHENYYDIIVVSEFQESSYKVEKTSGKIFDAEHAHLSPSPFENQNKDVRKEIN